MTLEDKRDWISFLPEWDREQARKDPDYRDAIEKTLMGEMTQLEAAAQPLGNEVKQHVADLRSKFEKARDESLAKWFRRYW